MIGICASRQVFVDEPNGSQRQMVVPNMSEETSKLDWLECSTSTSSLGGSTPAQLSAAQLKVGREQVRCPSIKADWVHTPSHMQEAELLLDSLLDITPAVLQGIFISRQLPELNPHAASCTTPVRCVQPCLQHVGHQCCQCPVYAQSFHRHQMHNIRPLHLHQLSLSPTSQNLFMHDTCTSTHTHTHTHHKSPRSSS